MAQRLCRVCGGWHDLSGEWPSACYGHFSGLSAKRSDGVQIIKDIEPYQAMGADVASGGKAPKIMGRRQHREYLKNNGYSEVGTEKPVLKPTQYSEVTPREVRQAYERLRDERRGRN